MKLKNNQIDVMIGKVLCVLWFLGAVCAVCAELTDEEYYSMPHLFELDDYDECMGLRGAFCMGSFQLGSAGYSPLLDRIQKFSSNPFKFNHTRIHRGYCLTSTCSHMPPGSLPQVFQSCVQNITKTKYGLDTELLSLEYCKTSRSPPMKIDVYDIIVGCVAGVIVVANVIGTAYDFLRNKDDKPNEYLITWSLKANWKRLTATHEKGDSRLAALNPIHGMKAITLILVIMVHSLIAHHMTYIQNPRFLEENSLHPLATLLFNGTAVVQTFIILSSFLLAYNVLISLDKNPEKRVDFAFWCKIVVHRIIRITPLYLFVVGLTATWWRFIGSGAMWKTLVEDESARCRRKWWTHPLYINNLVGAEDRCLIQSWFLATDMQLYIIASILLVLLVRRPRTAIKILAGVFVFLVILNFVIAYTLNFKTILFISFPEVSRNQYFGMPSFTWLYATAWGSAPAAILGLILAFVYHLMRTNDYNLQQNKWFCTYYKLSIPCTLAWILAGNFVRDWTSPLLVSLYTALERPVFDVLISTAIIGFFYKIDNVYTGILCWLPWRILSRLSLSVLLIHWCFNLTLLGVDTINFTSVFNISGHTFTTLILTYLTSVPLYLMVETPSQKFLQVLFS